MRATGLMNSGEDAGYHSTLSLLAKAVSITAVESSSKFVGESFGGSVGGSMRGNSIPARRAVELAAARSFDFAAFSAKNFSRPPTLPPPTSQQFSIVWFNCLQFEQETEGREDDVVARAAFEENDEDSNDGSQNGTAVITSQLRHFVIQVPVIS